MRTSTIPRLFAFIHHAFRSSPHHSCSFASGQLAAVRPLAAVIAATLLLMAGGPVWGQTQWISDNMELWRWDSTSNTTAFHVEFPGANAAAYQDKAAPDSSPRRLAPPVAGRDYTYYARATRRIGRTEPDVIDRRRGFRFRSAWNAPAYTVGGQSQQRWQRDRITIQLNYVRHLSNSTPPQSMHIYTDVYRGTSRIATNVYVGRLALDESRLFDIYLDLSGSSFTELRLELKWSASEGGNTTSLIRTSALGVLRLSAYDQVAFSGGTTSTNQTTQITATLPSGFRTNRHSQLYAIPGPGRIGSPTPPTISITTPSGNQTVAHATTSVAFSGTATAPGSTVSRVEWRRNGGSWANASGTTSWSFNASNLAVGNNLIEVRAINAQGLASSIAARTVTREALAPAPTVTVANPATATFTIAFDQLNYTITGTAAASGSSVEAVEARVNGAGQWYVLTSPGQTSWSFPASGLQVGDNLFEFRARNAQGTLSAMVARTIVRQAPAPSVTVSSPASTLVVVPHPQTTFTIAGTAAASGSSVEAVEARVNGAGQWYVLTSPGQTSWSFPASGLQVGDNLFEFRARNAQGTLSAMVARTIVRSAAAPPDAFEPNDSLAEAKPISLTPPVTEIRNLTLIGEDWYRIPMVRNRHLKLSALFTHDEGNLNIQLFDPRSIPAQSGEWGTIVAESYSTTSDEHLFYINNTNAPELYLRAYGETGSTNQSYTLRIETFDVDDIYSIGTNGNSFACSNDVPTLQMNVQYENLILRENDWYRFQIPPGTSQVDVELRRNFFSGNLQLVVVEDVPGACGAWWSHTLGWGTSNLALDLEAVRRVPVAGRSSILVRVYGAIRDTNFYSLRMIPSMSGLDRSEAVETPVFAAPAFVLSDADRDVLAAQVSMVDRNAPWLGAQTIAHTEGNTVLGPLVLDTPERWYRIETRRLTHLRIAAQFQHAQGDINLQLWDPRATRPTHPSDWGIGVAESYSTTDNEDLSYVNLTDPTELYLRVYSESGEATGQEYILDIDRTTLDDAISQRAGGNAGPCDITGASLALGRYENLVLRRDDWYRFDVAGVNRVNLRLDYRFFSGNLHVMVFGDAGGCAGVWSHLMAGSYTMLPLGYEQLDNLDVSGMNTLYVRVYGAIRDTNFYTLEVTEAP